MRTASSKVAFLNFLRAGSSGEQPDGGGDGDGGGLDFAGGLGAPRRRLEEHKNIATQDAAKGNSKDVGPRTPERTGVREALEDSTEFKQKAEVDALIKWVEKEVANPTQQFLKQLKQFRQVDDCSLPDGAKVRIGPEYCAKVYKNGNAQNDWINSGTQHNVFKNKAFQEILGSAIAMDYLLLVDQAGVINSARVESPAREIHGGEQAFGEVWVEEDWKPPKGAKNWQSNVRWGLRDRYSVRALVQGGIQLAAADSEVRDRMESEALFSKCPSKSKTDGPTIVEVTH